MSLAPESVHKGIDIFDQRITVELGSQKANEFLETLAENMDRRSAAGSGCEDCR